MHRSNNTTKINKRKRKEEDRSNNINNIILNDVKAAIDSEDYWIPEHWPFVKTQRGPNCGLYALENGLKFSHPEAKIPPARKDGDSKIVSMRQIAKAKKFTEFGEILNIESLRKLSNYFGFKNCQTSYNFYVTQHEYTDTICRYLKKGGCFIVAADMDDHFNYPASSQGLHTHWALVFGYYYSNENCNLLVAHRGDFYIWSANSLFQCNKDLPIDNPRKKSNIYYNKEIGFFKESKKFSYIKDKRHSLEPTLDKFRFSLCYIPSSTPINRLEIDIPPKTKKRKR